MSVIKTGTTSTTGYIVESDTNGNLVIQTGSTPTTALTLNSNQTATFAQSVNIPNTFGFKNRIINGGMVIDQRNAGASYTPTTAAPYTVDRFYCNVSQASKLTAQRNAGAVTPPAGFSNYLGITSSSAYSVLAGDYFGVIQSIEGFNTADLNWGTASAQAVTLSFWVRSSLTGTFGGTLFNSGLNRSYAFSYSIGAANTWEQKTVTIAGDTAGTWLTNNGIGISVNFNLGTGATYSGATGAWSGSLLLAPTGATSVVGTNGATFYITGVQLERGSTATSFDFRPYGTELALCQRYYQRIGSTGAINAAVASGVNFSTTTGITYCKFITTMRAAPTGSVTTASNFLLLSGGYATTGSAVSVYTMGTDSTRVDVTTAGLTTGQGNVLYIVSTTDAIQLAAEL